MAYQQSALGAPTQDQLQRIRRNTKYTCMYTPWYSALGEYRGYIRKALAALGVSVS